MVFKNGPIHGNLATDIMSKSLEYVHCALSFNASARLSQKLIRWERLATGWLKLNMDGSASEQLGVAGGGGIVRDEEEIGLLGLLEILGEPLVSLPSFRPCEMGYPFALPGISLRWKWKWMPKS